MASTSNALGEEKQNNNTCLQWKPNSPSNVLKQQCQSFAKGIDTQIRNYLPSVTQGAPKRQRQITWVLHSGHPIEPVHLTWELFFQHPGGKWTAWLKLWRKLCVVAIAREHRDKKWHQNPLICCRTLKPLTQFALYGSH